MAISRKSIFMMLTKEQKSVKNGLKQKNTRLTKNFQFQ